MKTSIEIACANMNWGPRELATLGLAGTEKFLTDTGYKNLEVTPMRGPLHIALLGQWVRRTFGGNDQSASCEAATRIVGSLHQSWRSEGLGEAALAVARHLTKGRLGEAATMLKVAMACPEEKASLRTMEMYQFAAGKSLPAVLYPGTKNEPLDLPEIVAFSPRLFQPTPDVWQQWGINSVEEMAEVMKKQYFDGLCIDTFHLRRRSKDGLRRLPPWEEFLADVETYKIPVGEVHLAMGRVDYQKHASEDSGEMQDTTRKEFEAAQESADAMERTVQGQMLLGLAALWRVQKQQRQESCAEQDKLRIVTEIPAAACDSPLVDTHRKIVEHTKTLLS